MKWTKKQGLKIAIITCLLLLLLLSFFMKNPQLFSFYEQFVFLPYQQFRSAIFNIIPFSFGDIFYAFLLVVLLFSLFRLFRFLFRWKKQKIEVGKCFFRSVASLLFIYVLYFYSWGANYNRAKLWVPSQEDTVWNTEKLVALNDTLINALNIIQLDKNKSTSLPEMNKKVRAVYQNNLGKQTPDLQVKSTLLGNMIFYLGIQGYYNPFSGEAQFAKSLPQFMWGFVIAHEMAHQAGIAAEGEANFMAYVMCTKSNDLDLKYSAYFNLFLYANRELERTDSVLAAQKLQLLKPKNLENINNLKQFRLQFKSVFRGTALSIYNWMLQSQGQSKGLKSYGDISRLVYFWEAGGEPDVQLYK